MLIKEIKKGNRTIYKKANFLDKMNYYEDIVYAVIFGVTIGCLVVFAFLGWI